MSVRMSKTRRQKRLIAESEIANNALKKHPQALLTKQTSKDSQSSIDSSKIRQGSVGSVTYKTPSARKAFKDLQPSSDSPNILVGSSGSITKVTGKNPRRAVASKSSTSSVVSGISLDKENTSTMKKKLPSNPRGTSSQKKLSYVNGDRTARKSVTSRQSKISEFAKISTTEKVKKQEKPRPSVAESNPSEISKIQDDIQRENQVLYETYKCDAEKLRLRLKEALSTNELLWHELSAVEAENAKLKESIDQVAHLRDLLQDYQEQQPDYV